MTTKELRELARTTLAAELKADQVNADKASAAIQVLHLPADPDEERARYEQQASGGEASLPNLNQRIDSRYNAAGAAGSVDRQFIKPPQKP